MYLSESEKIELDIFGFSMKASPNRLVNLLCLVKMCGDRANDEFMSKPHPHISKKKAGEEIIIASKFS